MRIPLDKVQFLKPMEDATFADRLNGIYNYLFQGNVSEQQFSSLCLFLGLTAAYNTYYYVQDWLQQNDYFKNYFGKYRTVGQIEVCTKLVLMNHMLCETLGVHLNPTGGDMKVQTYVPNIERDFLQGIIGNQLLLGKAFEGPDEGESFADFAGNLDYINKKLTSEANKDQAGIAVHDLAKRIFEGGVELEGNTLTMGGKPEGYVAVNMTSSIKFVNETVSNVVQLLGNSIKPEDPYQFANKNPSFFSKLDIGHKLFDCVDGSAYMYAVAGGTITYVLFVVKTYLSGDKKYVNVPLEDKKFIVCSLSQAAKFSIFTDVLPLLMTAYADPILTQIQLNYVMEGGFKPENIHTHRILFFTVIFLRRATLLFGSRHILNAIQTRFSRESGALMTSQPVKTVAILSKAAEFYTRGTIPRICMAMMAGLVLLQYDILHGGMGATSASFRDRTTSSK